MDEQIPATADLYDEFDEALESCDLQFRQFGGQSSFQGSIVTVRCHEDNVVLSQVLSAPGEGRVVVVDGNGSTHRALLGDNMAGRAAENEWAGIIVNGAVRDTGSLKALPLGLKALGSNPRKSTKTGAGQRDVVVSFGGATFTPGAHLVSDDDGIVVLAVKP